MNFSAVSGATEDFGVELLAKLRDLVPAAFSDGTLDPGALLQALGATDLPSGFAFSWPGIEGAREAARAPTTATLVPDQPASVQWDNARDVLIEGDNLQVLKLLKRGYTGAAKLIYIDPPYNTGENFTYNDDFAIPEKEYLISSCQVDDQGVAVTSKIEKGGRKHAPWLSFIFPRLAVARHLLKRDGVLVVSIDNNEVHHLRILLDSLFGAANFLDMITWQGGRKGDARLTAGGQDYLLVYARDLGYLKQLNTKWRERKTGLEEVHATERRLLAEHGEDYVAATCALRKWYEELPEGNPSKQHSHYDRIDSGGVWTSDNSSSPNYRENLIYDFKGYSPPENGWRYELATMEKLDAAGKLIYPSGKAKRIRIKKYLHEQEYWAPASSFYRDRSGASAALEALMGGAVFDNPKSTDVLARFIGAITGDGDLIVDFFAGSGSTGQAVWEQVKADGKARRWLLVQAPEPPDPEEPTGKAALEAGFTTIFEITAERLRRVSASMQVAPGFRVFRARETQLRVSEPIVAGAETTGEDYVQLSLAHMEGAPVVDGAVPSAVAWEVVLKSTNLPLDATVRTHTYDGVEVFEFTAPGAEGAAGRLLVSLGPFTLSIADELGLQQADTLILRGDLVDDATTLTLAPRLQSKLLLIERVPREVSL